MLETEIVLHYICWISIHHRNDETIKNTFAFLEYKLCARQAMELSLTARFPKTEFQIALMIDNCRRYFAYYKLIRMTPPTSNHDPRTYNAMWKTWGKTLKQKKKKNIINWMVWTKCAEEWENRAKCFKEWEERKCYAQLTHLITLSPLAPSFGWAMINANEYALHFDDMMKHLNDLNRVTAKPLCIVHSIQIF